MNESWGFVGFRLHRYMQQLSNDAEDSWMRPELAASTPSIPSASDSNRQCPGLESSLESLILVCTVEWLSADSARQLRSAGALTDIGGLGGDSGIAAAGNGHLHGPWILRACVNLSEDNDKVNPLHCY